MATHDYVIANGTGAAVRSDINGALAAIVSQNSSASEPSPTYAYMRWADTTAGVMKMRNGANSAWISLYQLDGEWTSIAFENGTAAAPSIYFKDSGTDTGIYSPGTDQVAISTGGTGRLFVGASGFVGIGTTEPGGTLDIKAAASTAPLIVQGPSSEFCRIDSSGRLLVGTSTGVAGALVRVEGGISINGVTASSAVNSEGHYISPVVNSGGQNTCKSATNDTSGSGDLWQYSRINTDGVIFRFHRGTTSVGTVSITSSATSYTTSSDYRLKENVVLLTGAIDRLQQIPVHRFNFIVDPDKTVDGFLAHEAQEVVPECVTGEKDAVDDDGNPVYQGIDQSKLVPLLTAALQEAIAKIEALEIRLSALEAA